MRNNDIPWTCQACQKLCKPGGKAAHLKWCGVDPAVKFWPKVTKRGPDECWEWIGARVPAGGYGRFLYKGKLIAAHRVAYLLAHGELPTELDIMHVCDNPPCCNPAHLIAATTLENMRDAKRKGRHCYGERSIHAKITEAQAIEILKAKPENVRGSRHISEALAACYGIKPSAVLCIWRGDSWSHLQ